MESSNVDQFVVFVRHDFAHANRPDYTEQPLLSCSSYEEARQLVRSLHLTPRECVIRFVGTTGGSD